jgi:hypothetical protein
LANLLRRAQHGEKEDKVRQNQNLKRSTIVKNVRQIDLFMQNKANSCMAKINSSSFVTSK